MPLVANWRRVLRHAWSIRLIVLTWLLTAAEVGFGFFTDDPPLPRATFAALAMATTLAAAIARFVAQRTVSGDSE